MKSTTKKVLVAAIAVAALVLAISFFTSLLPLLQHSTAAGSTSPSSSASKTVYFTIIESDKGPDEGMNGSAYHVGEPWPVMEVQQGDTVVIHIVSEDSLEAHGFTIEHYFDPGVGLLPGGTYTVKFVANDNGTFVITCLLFCAIHPLMDYGKFIVNA
jgi:FtsP/CotA-like multicopper oxidase with cupredoxin domain